MFAGSYINGETYRDVTTPVFGHAFFLITVTGGKFSEYTR